MVFRVEKVSGGYAILLPPEVGEEWALRDGSAVEVTRIGSLSSEIAYAGREQALEGYQRMALRRRGPDPEKARSAKDQPGEQGAPVEWWQL